MKTGVESVKGLMMLKVFVKKLQRSLLVSASKVQNLTAVKLDEDLNAAKMVPEDVMKGHFAVIAMKGGEAKRFILELECLSDPDFMRLLEQAEEEFGFQQKGVLTLPCQPEELQTILGHRRRRRMSTER